MTVRLLLIFLSASPFSLFLADSDDRLLPVRDIRCHPGTMGRPLPHGGFGIFPYKGGEYPYDDVLGHRHRGALWRSAIRQGASFEEKGSYLGDVGLRRGDLPPDRLDWDYP